MITAKTNRRQTVLITGASSGIGLAAAERMRDKGWTVYASVRKEADFQRLEKLSLNPVYIDVTNPEMIEKAIQDITAKGPLDAIVNNAGIAVAGPVEGVKLQDYRAQLDVNFLGPIAVIQKALPALRQSQGRIVNISSISGLIATPLLSAYTSSKYALEAMSDSLRREVEPLGVKVIIIEPGNIATPIWEKSEKSNEAHLSEYPEAIVKVYAEPIARLRQMAREAVKTAAPVKKVADAVEKALCHRQPRTRYLVGWDAKMGALLANTIPDRLLDRVVRRFV